MCVFACLCQALVVLDDWINNIALPERLEPMFALLSLVRVGPLHHVLYVCRLARWLWNYIVDKYLTAVLQGIGRSIVSATKGRRGTLH